MIRKGIGLFAWLAVISVVAFMAGCGGGHPKKARDSRRYIREHSLERLPSFDVPMEMNDRVVAWMEYFQGPGKGHFRRYLERSGRYVPLMQDILRKEGLPKDLIYIALIESGFNTQARSHAAAVGPWQFIASTGRRYNLEIGGWVDERRDPYKSTYAATQYLKDLYSEFGDWYLAMAAYNAGEGRIRRAIASTGSRSFWGLADDRRALKAETRDYVPKYIAAAIMAKMPEKFGFGGIDYREPFDYDSGVVETQTDLSVIAKCAGTSEDDIFDLNPHLIRGATPPGAGNYEIRIPKGKARVFAELYAKLPPDERISVARHTVRRGETLARIARRYGVSAASLASANGINPRRYHLKQGTTLVIPTGSLVARYASVADVSQGLKSPAKKNSSRHTVRRGETLGAIAKRYGVTANQIMAWNGIKNPRKIHTGMRLAIRSEVTSKNVDESAGGKAEAAGIAGEKVLKEHKVAKGDTIQMIARRYGVTPKQLLAMNDIRDPKQLRPGTKLVIRKGRESKGADSPVNLPDAAPTPVVQSSEQTAAQTPVREILMTEATQLQSLSERPAEAAHTPIKISDVKKPNSPATSPLSYQVKNGDTLWDIARRHKVKIADIQKWNNLKDPSAVRPGAMIKIQR